MFAASLCHICPWMSYMLGRGVVVLWFSVCCYVGDFPSWTSSTKCRRILKLDLYSSLLWCSKGQKAPRGQPALFWSRSLKNSLGSSGLQNIRYCPFFCVEWKARWTSLGCTVRRRGRASPQMNSAFPWPFPFP